MDITLPFLFGLGGGVTGMHINFLEQFEIVGDTKCWDIIESRYCYNFLANFWNALTEDNSQI